MRARVVAALVAATVGVVLALVGAAPASAAWEVGSAPDGFEVGGVTW